LKRNGLLSSEENLVTVIGRGNSGTRVISQSLYASGVFLGETLNDCGDTVPPGAMYKACLLIAEHVRWTGELSWDFDQLHSMEIDSEFIDLVTSYLDQVLKSSKPRRGWKLPETTLGYPWIVRMFPEIKYIHIVRDPRDCLLGSHLTDDLKRCNVQYPETDDQFAQRVASWKYQHEIVKATPQPKHFLSIRFEDLVLDHESTMQQLEVFLGFPLARVIVEPTRVGRWKSDPRVLPHIAPLEPDMLELRYI
jgi:Sulfotransferase family